MTGGIVVFGASHRTLGLQVRVPQISFKGYIISATFLCKCDCVNKFASPWFCGVWWIEYKKCTTEGRPVSIKWITFLLNCLKINIVQANKMVLRTASRCEITSDYHVIFADWKHKLPITARSTCANGTDSLQQQVLCVVLCGGRTLTIHIYTW